MIVPLAFWLMLVTALAIGWQAGDRQDRTVLAAIFLAAVLTALAEGKRRTLVLTKKLAISGAMVSSGESPTSATELATLRT